MFELKGKYADAKVFASVADEQSIAQVVTLLNQPYAEGSRIRMMPDIHAGAGCTIGTTMTITDKICPNLVGVDIGCGMETVQIIEKDFDPAKLDEVIRSSIPSGFSIRDTAHRYAKSVNIEELYCAKHVDLDRAFLSIGTLGGGNHFIEADRDEDGNVYIVVHSGSRHLGLEVANYYQNEAYRSLTKNRPDIEQMIEELKAAGRANEIQAALKKAKGDNKTIQKDLAYVEGDLFDQYIHDMKIAQAYASANRLAIVRAILEGMDFHFSYGYSTVHNYIDTERMILRKGAVSAQAGEHLLIPINMRDGSLICVGKGNEDWNCSAPHGAGRIMSRSEAKRRFTIDEFENEMNGIYSTSVDESTIDECPMAYKSMDAILENIGPTVEVEHVIKPIYNFKASGGDFLS